MNLFIYYPKCSTCNKVKQFLDTYHIKYQERDIKNDKLSKEEIRNIINKYNIPIKKLFNTSGILYRKLLLKEKLEFMNEEEKIELLSSDGMLVKRPIFITNTKCIIGSSIKEYEGLL